MIDNRVGSVVELTTLLQLHARLPKTNLEYVPDRVVEQIGPGQEPCNNCIAIMEAEEYGRSAYSIDDECICDDEDMDYDEWVELEKDRMHYTKALEDVLNNNNDKWLEDLRLKKMKVVCTFSFGINLPVFRISCTEVLGSTTSTTDAAWDLLSGWGLLSLPHRDMMEFVVAFEKKTKKTFGEYDVVRSAMCEIRVPQSKRRA